jgi:hypothetical protein
MTNGGGGGNLIVCPILRYSTTIFLCYYNVPPITMPKMLDVVRQPRTTAVFIGREYEIVLIVNVTFNITGCDRLKLLQIPVVT